jgi:hypothetical protein
MVIFNTNDYTFHGNPEPVRCPPGMARRSIAMYYYTNGRPANEWSGVYQTTHFMNRPGERIAEPERLVIRMLRLIPKPLRMSLSRFKARGRAAKKTAMG